MLEENQEYLIKSKKRVQKHGEVFTPQKTVKEMLDLPGVREACEDLQTTFLEPSAGEGAFLLEVLTRKLTMVSRNYSKSLEQYENFSLLALSTLYGVELLPDNTQICSINLFQIFNDFYREQAQIHSSFMKRKVQDSAKTLISRNIKQGDFLTKRTLDNKPIIFSEWTPKPIRKGQKKITVYRTEYSLEDIYSGLKRNLGDAYSVPLVLEQMDLFSFNDSFDDYAEEVPDEPILRYIPVNITDIYKEEMEAIDGNSN